MLEFALPTMPKALTRVVIIAQVSLYSIRDNRCHLSKHSRVETVAMEYVA